MTLQSIIVKGVIMSVLAPVAMAALGLPAYADDDTDRPTANYDDVAAISDAGASDLMNQAEAAIRSNRFDHAIALARKGLDKDEDDIDLHKIYAKALEGKLSQTTKTKDPYLYRKCVEEWLCVMRSGRGDEKGLNVKGVGGIADYFYKDDERYIEARHHLVSLTGAAPRAWESNSRYLKRALKPVAEVQGDVMK